MSTPDTVLVQQLLAREPHAMTDFYQTYHTSLYSVIKRLIRNTESAEDVLQESLLKIWRNIASYDPEKGLLFSWAVKICCNTAVDYLRTRQTRFDSQTQSLEETPAIYQLAVSMDAYSAKMDIATVLNLLRDDHRKVIELLYLEDYTQVEVADALQLPLGTIKTWSTAAKRRMALYLVGR